MRATEVQIEEAQVFSYPNCPLGGVVFPGQFGGRLLGVRSNYLEMDAGGIQAAGSLWLDMGFGVILSWIVTS